MKSSKLLLVACFCLSCLVGTQLFAESKIVDNFESLSFSDTYKDIHPGQKLLLSRSSECKEGKYSLSVNTVVAKDYVDGLLREIDNENWSEYKGISLWIKADKAGKSKVLLRLRNGKEWHFISNGYDYIDTSTDWVCVKKDISSIPRDDVTGIMIYTNRDGKGELYTLYLDDIRLIKEEVGAPAKKNEAEVPKKDGAARENTEEKNKMPKENLEEILSQWGLLKDEVRKISKEGYDVRPVEILFDSKTWARAAKENGKSVKESELECLRRAKGMLIALKLPRWANDYRYEQSFTNDKNLSSRDVCHFGRNWGGWYCVARPATSVLRDIDTCHSKGRKTGFYIEGCLAPNTIILMPDMANRITPASNAYANGYTHRKEEWWGLSGSFPEHQKWMAQQVELLARMGFDGGYIDSALSAKTDLGSEQDTIRNKNFATVGGWTGIQETIRKHSNFVMALNNCGNPFIDDAVLKYNMPVISELGKSPSKEIFDLLAFNVYNSPAVAWITKTDDGPGSADLSYGLTLSHKFSYPMVNPSQLFQEFTRKYSNYISRPDNEIYISQERVKLISPEEKIKHTVFARHLPEDKNILIVNVYNMNPAETKKDVRLQIDSTDLSLPKPNAMTYLTPGAEPLELKVEKRSGNKADILIPELKIWGILVMGTPIPPQIAASVEKQAVGSTSAASVNVKNLSGGNRTYDVSFISPEGWKTVPGKGKIENKDSSISLEISIPEGCAEGTYAITPVLTDENGNQFSDWPIQIQAVSPLTFKWRPPFIYLSKGPRMIELEVTNNTDKKINGELRLDFPPGWLKRNSQKIEGLAPSATGKLTVEINPQSSNIKLWEFNDIAAKISWLSGAAKGVVELPLRTFPASYYVFPEDILNIFREVGWYFTGFPQLVFVKGGIENALKTLDTEGYGTIWIGGNDEYYRYGRMFEGRLNDFVNKGGGLVVTSASIKESDLLPVELGEMCEKEDLKLLEDPLTESVYRLKKEFKGKFKAMQIKPKEWGKVIATWGDGTPAIVVSKKPGLRVAFIGSTLEGNYEFVTQGKKYMDEKWKENLWLITGLYDELFRWTSGVSSVEKEK